MDLQVIAFQTDMTRVITFMLGRAGSNRPYRNIGISDGHHSITHHQNDPVKIANVAKIDAYLVADLRLLPAEAEGHARWRRQPARSQPDSLRQRSGRRQHPHASRTADRRARRRRRPAQGRTPPEVRQGHSAEQSAGQHARHGRRPHRKLRRRHRRTRTPHLELRRVKEYSCDRKAMALSAASPSCCARQPLGSDLPPGRRPQAPRSQGRHLAARAARRRQRRAARWRDSRSPGPPIWTIASRPNSCSPPAPRSKIADEYGETPLTLAAANGDAALVGKLLKAGANASAARWDGETALMIAANAGSVETVKQLIAAGADVNRGRIAQGTDRPDVGRRRRPPRRSAGADRQQGRYQRRVQERLHGPGLRRD